MNKSNLDEDAYPTPEELLQGIQNWLIGQAQEKMEEGQELEQVIQLYKEATN